MPRERIVLLGGSFNMPTRAHNLCARLLAGHFDRVPVVVCGIRPDKLTGSLVSPMHRARMCQLEFRGIPKVDVDLSDLDRAEFMATMDLDRLWKRQCPGDEIWHAIGSDLIVGGRSGASEIQRKWREGQAVWNTLRFAVISRPGYPFTDADLPPNARVMPFDVPDDSSTKARELISAGQDAGEIISPQIARYIARFGLYGMGSGSQTEGRLLLPANPKLFVIPDPMNPRAVNRASRLKGRCKHVEEADLIVAIGGDGTMLYAAHKFHGCGVPILGLNAGHVGFLLNGLSPTAVNERIAGGLPFTTHLLPMLAVSIQGMDGTWGEEQLVFQDAWLKIVAQNSGAAWFRVTVEGRRKRVVEKIVCGAILGCNPVGSGAYFKSMGGQPFPLSAAQMGIGAACPSSPAKWGPAQVANTSVITFEALSVEKRPVLAATDGQTIGPARGMRIRQSAVAGVELAYLPEYTLGDKLEELCFPAG